MARVSNAVSAVAALLAVMCGCATAGLVTKGSSEEMPLPPVCHSITCADIECLSPLELRRQEGQCCPVCWAPDHVVGLDRHESTGDLGFRKEVHPAAPTTCSGAKCFTPACPTGQQVGHVSGRCCASCVAR
eukprot:TRINITY_DN122053_c0_g1_i1.p2 TRINITY_DN122053_c0_g1~~TRINITY_DN122053_c0_g1_i1.p2  ORF type:complete len:131 (+),score=19.98 TRINITY_DN122053_c0_g1_i1:92-484(+)